MVSVSSDNICLKQRANESLVGGLLATSGEWVAYHVTILFAVQLLVQCFLLPETLYPREAVTTVESRGGRAEDLNISRSKQLGYLVSLRRSITL